MRKDAGGFVYLCYHPYLVPYFFICFVIATPTKSHSHKLMFNSYLHVAKVNIMVPGTGLGHSSQDLPISQGRWCSSWCQTLHGWTHHHLVPLHYKKS